MKAYKINNALFKNKTHAMILCNSKSIKTVDTCEDVIELDISIVPDIGGRHYFEISHDTIDVSDIHDCIIQFTFLDRNFVKFDDDVNFDYDDLDDDTQEMLSEYYYEHVHNQEYFIKSVEDDINYNPNY